MKLKSLFNRWVAFVLIAIVSLILTILSPPTRGAAQVASADPLAATADNPIANEKASVRKPIKIATDRAKELQNLFAAAQNAQQRYEFAASLFVDRGSPCVQQALLLLQKESESRVYGYNTNILQTRIDLEVPKGWQYNAQAGEFEPPKKE